MMLAVSTTQSLVVVELSVLKRNLPELLSPVSSLSSPTSLTWSPDNSALFVSSSTAIDRYDPAGTSFKTVWSSSGSHPGPISALVSKDRGSAVIFAREQQIHILETHTGKISQTFDTHNARVAALALSHDGSLLASISPRAAHVHNLSHSAHTMLRGLPAGSGSLAACAFHPHSRTRLLVACGTQLLVYDTSRPSAPVKAIPMEKEKGVLGTAVAIASSPFSKTLVAVAFSGGIVVLVDLEKDKGLFRTLSLHVPLTSLVFSAEGATLYAGTENGKLLIQDLRSLDKPPKAITVSSEGDRVVSICMQKKLKSDETPAKGTTTATAKPLSQQDVNQKPMRTASVTLDKKAVTAAHKGKAAVGASPISSRVVSGVSGSEKARSASDVVPRAQRPRNGSSASVISPARPSGTRTVSGADAKSTVARKASGGVTKKRVFSPPKSPLKRTTVADDDEDNMPEELDVSVRIESLLALPKAVKKENVDPAESPPILSASNAPPRASARERTRTSSSRTTSSASSGRPDSRGSTRASANATARTTKSSFTATSVSPIPPVPTLPTVLSRRPNSRTPSPELPEPDVHGPTTPVPLGKKDKERMAGVLGLGTPEVERWARAGDDIDIADDDDNDAAPRDSKRVEFAGDDVQDADMRMLSDNKTDGPALAMQVSPAPRRPPRTGSSWAPVLSPLRNPTPASPRAQDLLQTLLRDALHDFRQETRSEIVGLHLDLVRMGRGWRREMREAMGEFGDELRALREENAQLREENERLRRGY